MPIARFQMPDGRIGRFEVPDGTTPDAAQSMIESNYEALIPKDSAPKQDIAGPSLARTALDQGLQGATFGFSDEPMDAIGALFAKYTPEALGGNPELFKDQSIGDIYGQARNLSKDRLQQEVQQNPFTSIASNIAGGLLTGGAGATTKAGSAVANSLRTGNAASRIIKGALAGSASGGLYGAGSADDGNRLEGAEQGAAYGGVVGGAIPAVSAAGGAIKNAILPNVSDPITAALAQKALDEGIPLRRSQISDSRVAQGIASVTKDIPFSGAGAFADKQTTAFNKAVLAKAGIDAEKATPAILSDAADDFNKKFSSIIGKTTVNIDTAALDDLGKIEQEASKRYGADGRKLVGSYIDDVLSSGGKIDGQTYQNTRSQLGKMAKAKGASDPFMAGLLKNIQSTLDDAALRSLPSAEQQQWQEVRQQYGAFKTIQKAMNSTSGQAAIGNISPAALASAAKTGNPNYARGAGELNDLARIGGRFVRDNVPNTGTAQRLMTYGALGSAGTAAALNPAILVAALKAIGTSAAFNAADTSQSLVRNAIKGNAGRAVSPLLSIPAGAAAAAIHGTPETTAPLKIAARPKQNPSLVDRFAQAESAGNPNAVNPDSTSTASGLLGFTNGTWKRMVAKYGYENGVKLSDKNDPGAQKLMAQALIDENRPKLASSLGREPTDGELYLAHFAGADGAKRLLAASENTPAARVLPQAAQQPGNKSIFYDGKRLRSVGEVVQLLENKVN